MFSKFIDIKPGKAPLCLNDIRYLSTLLLLSNSSIFSLFTDSELVSNFISFITSSSSSFIFSTSPFEIEFLFWAFLNAFISFFKELNTSFSSSTVLESLSTVFWDIDMLFLNFLISLLEYSPLSFPMTALSISLFAFITSLYMLLL